MVWIFGVRNSSACVQDDVIKIKNNMWWIMDIKSCWQIYINEVIQKLNWLDNCQTYKIFPFNSSTFIFFITHFGLWWHLITLFFNSAKPTWECFVSQEIHVIDYLWCFRNWNMTVMFLHRHLFHVEKGNISEV
jgi:hypothetical protein